MSVFQKYDRKDVTQTRVLLIYANSELKLHELS